MMYLQLLDIKDSMADNVSLSKWFQDVSLKNSALKEGITLKNLSAILCLNNMSTAKEKI